MTDIKKIGWKILDIAAWIGITGYISLVIWAIIEGCAGCQK